MRLWTFFLLVLGAAALAAIGWIIWQATADHRAWRELLSYAGKNLHQLDAPQKQRLNDLIRLRLPRSPEEGSFVEPWRILRLDPEGAAILLEAATVHSIPGSFDVESHLFSSEGRWLSSAEFSGGWRMTWTGVDVVDSAHAGSPLLEVQSDNGFGGADISRQYYAVLGDRLELIRLENDDGQVAENLYWAPNLRIGPKPPDRSVEEWERALESGSPAEVLRTLTWLGGTHWDSRYTLRQEFCQTLEEVQRVKDVRERPGVKGRLETLVRSANPWIAQAARLAASAGRK